jgi:hypothetical protein
MHCGVGRLASLVCLLLLALAISAGPAGAYRCGVAGSARTLSAHVTKADEKDCSAPPRKRGNADPISFAFFIGIIVAVLFVPIALGRSRLEPQWADPSVGKRKDLPPQ